MVDTFAVLGGRRTRGKQVFPVFRGAPGRGIPEVGSHLTGTVTYLRGFKSPACEEIGICLRWLKPAESGNNNVHLTASNEAAFRRGRRLAQDLPQKWVSCGLPLGTTYPERHSMAAIFRSFLPLALGIAFFGSGQVHAVSIDWVTVGDPGNAADTGGLGTVAESFRIMKYEFTNQQYADFLNSVAATDPYSLYNSQMGSDARGGITQSGASGSYIYAVKTNMGDKPVNFVSWFDAARVSNWLMNGATGTSSTETGAYTLNGATSGTAPAVNSGAPYYIPTGNQWYKAAYYQGGGTAAGYWSFATQSTPLPVTAGTTGIGSAGSTGNFANFDLRADWNGQNGNVTSVGTNGGPSAYGTFDMSGNVTEFTDSSSLSNEFRDVRGGGWDDLQSGLLKTSRSAIFPDNDFSSIGFRLASSVAVPEPSTSCMALAGLACGGFSMWRRRKRA